MARIVLKFGGTSVGDIDRIKNVARKVKVEVDAGHQVAVVVSAMSGVTNKLVEYCAGIDFHLDLARHILDAVDVADRCAAEFENDPRHCRIAALLP